MKTVKELCELQPHALDVTVGDQVEDLEEIIQSTDGDAYFSKTFITEGMMTLLSDGIARLAGKSSHGVFCPRQAMGGGKTHSLIALAMLAKDRKLRNAKIGGVSHINDFESAYVAAFNGRNYPDGYFWGDVARQLGHEDMFAEYWRSGPKAPDKAAWVRLFQACAGPVLVILDEMPPYFQYYSTQVSGKGTVASIAAAALANMLVAAMSCSRVCVCVSTLDAAYAEAGAVLRSVLDNVSQELGRVAVNVTPVNLESSDIFGIIRTRLFKSVGTPNEIAETAREYERSLKEAVLAKSIPRHAVSMVHEIAETYPFHPGIKHVIAMFKENSEFKQTRGLLELLSRLLKSVWTSNEDVYLIGAQHFDFAIPEVREKISEISGMREILAKDVWNSAGNANAQKADQECGGHVAGQAAALLLVSSLSTALNAVKGLSEEDACAMLIDPNHSASAFKTAISALLKSAWYLHQRRRDDGESFRLCFDRQENVNRRLETYALAMPENKVDEFVKAEFKTLFAPQTRDAYECVLPLPRLEEAESTVNSQRVLLVAYPNSTDSFIEGFFNSLTSKNNFLVLTGEFSEIANIQNKARQYLAVKKIKDEIAEDHPHYTEIINKEAQFFYDFRSTLLNAYNDILFPRRDERGRSILKRKSIGRFDAMAPICSGEERLRRKNEGSRGKAQDPVFNGEEKITAALASDPLKLYPSIDDENFDAVRAVIEGKIFGTQEVLSRKALVDGLRLDASMPWLPHDGLTQVISRACERGEWEMLNDTRQITRCPKPKLPSVLVAAMPPDSGGTVRLQVEAVNAGECPRIHYAEDGSVSERSPVLSGGELPTKALRVELLAVDPSNGRTGVPTVWENELVIRAGFDKASRTVELRVFPRGRMFYSIDGSAPRDGIEYSGPFKIEPDKTTVQVFAECDGKENSQQFEYAAADDAGGGLRLDPEASVHLRASSPKMQNGRKAVHKTIALAKEFGIAFKGVMLKYNALSVNLEGIDVTADQLEKGLEYLSSFALQEQNCNMLFREAKFSSGAVFEKFCSETGIACKDSEIIQRGNSEVAE